LKESSFRGWPRPVMHLLVLRFSILILIVQTVGPLGALLLIFDLILVRCLAGIARSFIAGADKGDSPFLGHRHSFAALGLRLMALVVLLLSLKIYELFWNLLQAELSRGLSELGLLLGWLFAPTLHVQLILKLLKQLLLFLKLNL
jgi:hypothetical protein